MPHPHPYITKDEKSVIVRMHEHSGLNAQEIAESTARGLSTVYQILAMHCDTGQVSRAVYPSCWPRKLGPLEEQVHYID